ncbi:Gfo/Idh/MocA family protein [Phytomonospora endophytica]|uniref:Putative dehydrogenase n=1 Tax=Phytomonospora endophytica TaxID=714109 RepID=A0A841FGN7_9ACTN|nr:Gfo/Idh/MocA family oxidoreductase [Phytomonospora endophytica]MBB6033008.1 putative dehydrogenase [Phytomonospora endophytica]GIG65234.1 oxidoreductase [Phytomonospora endophytica]
MDDLRLGVAGLGLRASVALEAHRPGGGARVTAICDTDPARHEWAREKFGADVSVTADFGELLASGIDAVLILTPDDTHRALGERALAAGVATFMEKPLAITVEDTDALLALAHKHGTRLYVGHNMRHMPVIRAMREIILNGEIGEVQAVWCRHFVGHGGDFYYKDWHADRRRTTGLLLQKGAHDIDVIHWLAGASTRQVTAMGDLKVYGQVTDRQEVEGTKREDWYRPATNWPPLSQKGLHPTVDVEDISMMLMRLDNGVQASYQQCHFTPDYWRNYTVIGTEGRLENFGDTGGDAVVRVWNKGRRNYDAAGDKAVEIPKATGGHGGADSKLVDEFLRFVRDGGATDTSPVAARDSVAAGVCATESLRDGSRPRTVPAVDAELGEYFAKGQPGS